MAYTGVVGLLGRVHAQEFARRRTRDGRQVSYSEMRFVQALAAFTAVVGVMVVIGSIKTPSRSTQSTTARSLVPQGAIANINDLLTDSPAYLEYPSGYPNRFIKRAEGSLVAPSTLCTHVCCPCDYNLSSKQIMRP